MQRLIDYIQEYEDVISKPFCEHLITKFESNENQHVKGVVLKADGTPVIDLNRKQTTEINLDSTWDTEISSLLEVAGALTKRYADSFPWFDALYKSNKFQVEPIRLKRYTNEQCFNWHIDQNGSGTAKRLLAIQFYLNTCETGHTEFNGKSIKAIEGKALIFPTNFLFPHKGNIVLGEKKYICTLFITF